MTIAQRLSKGLFYLLIMPATLGLCGWQSWQWWSWASAPAIAEETVAGDRAIVLQIPEGTSARQIGYDLQAAGVIRSVAAWELWTRWQSLRDRTGGFQAGTYELSPAQPLAAIAAQIWQGDVVQQSITIPEGWSIQQMGEYFEQQGLFSAADFIAATEQIPRDRYPWLPDPLPKLEGFLYPDTYQLSAAITPEAIITQMLDRFEQVALPLHQRSNTTYSLMEWVTLASIVEREAVVQTERPTIASVFARRLREGIPLGADPTVEYAFGIRQTPEKPLTYAQVQTPSPYNTYINPGLPPTPISSPGLASLEASLAPAETDYLFFMARFDGTHIFSRTLAEHEAAKTAVDEALAAPTPTPAAPN